MARIIRAFFPQALVSAATEAPAAMEIISAPCPAKPANAGASPFSTCGLIATTQTDGSFFACDGAANSAIFFALANLRNSAEGLGSTTAMDLTPVFSQPLSKAEPIL